MDNTTTDHQYTIPDWPPEIWPEHRDYLATRGVTPAAARARGYRSVRAGSGRNADESYAAAYRGLPKTAGLLFPLHPLSGGDQRFLLRPDAPRVTNAGRTIKFESQAGLPNVLITSPLTREAVDGDGMLILTEGVSRVDALAAYGVPAVGLNGLSSWKSKGLPIACWEYLRARDRDVIIAPDGDMVSNPGVWRAARVLAVQLRNKGARRVGYLTVPEGLGLDDWIFKYGPADTEALMAALRPYVSLDEPAKPPPKRAKPGEGGEGGDELERIARGAANWARSRWRYDNDAPGDAGGWWRWRGTHWTRTDRVLALYDDLLEHRHAVAAIIAEESAPAADAFLEEILKRGSSSETTPLWSRLRQLLARPSPRPPKHEISTPGGVVNVITGKMVRHDPDIHDCRAVTKGRYRPEDHAYLRLVLDQRMTVTMDDDGVDTCVAMWGVGYAGVSHARSASILWAYGQPRSGKTGVAMLAVEASGTYGASVGSRIFGYHASDIDADLAVIHETEPRFVMVDESADDNINVGRMNAITGGDPPNGRRPHSVGIKGDLSSTVWCLASVTAPDITLSTGIGARMVVVACRSHLPSVYADSPTMLTNVFDADTLDAQVTLGIIAAATVYTDEWRRPQGNADALEDFASTADPIGAWLDTLPDSFAGTPVTNALAYLNTWLSEDDRPAATQTALGLALRGHKKWQSTRPTGGRSARVMTLRTSRLLR